MGVVFWCNGVPIILAVFVHFKKNDIGPLQPNDQQQWGNQLQKKKHKSISCEQCLLRMKVDERQTNYHMGSGLDNGKNNNNKQYLILNWTWGMFDS